MVGMKSDAGSVRELNEDYAAFIENDEYSLYIVADGMGGHNAGEVASKLAVESIINYFKDKYSKDYVDILKDSVEFANTEVYNMAHNNTIYKGMGTTLTACLINSDRIQVTNVGDSCCFAINGDNITKITKDHSWVQELIDLGAITEEEGRFHPKKNVITRALGTSEKVKVDIFNVEKDKYEKFLICSDGLINEIYKEEIVEILKCENDLDTACNKMIDLAKSRGGKDNITVLLFGGEV